MNYIISENTVQMHRGDHIAIEKQIPVGLYRLDFDEMQGHWLTRLEDVPVATKMYGDREKYIDKIFKTFNKFDRSLGVLLSGGKGIGKTMFSNHLIHRALENGQPVVLVNDATPGVENAIDTFSENTVVVFDEFEKRFPKDDDRNTQGKLLSLFDGQSAVKRLYIVTVNELHKVSDFMLNRPGRFHYHLRFANPQGEEIREYIKDNSTDISEKEIIKVIKYADYVELTYDQLRAITWELDDGTPFEEILATINVPNRSNEQKFELTFTRDGKTTQQVATFDPLAGCFGWFRIGGDDDTMHLEIADIRIEPGATEGTAEIVNLEDINEYVKDDADFHGVPDKKVLVSRVLNDSYNFAKAL